MLNIVISLGLELVAGELCYHSCRMASRNGFLVLAEIDLDMDDIMLKHSLIFRIEGPWIENEVSNLHVVEWNRLVKEIELVCLVPFAECETEILT